MKLSCMRRRRALGRPLQLVLPDDLSHCPGNVVDQTMSSRHQQLHTCVFAIRWVQSLAVLTLAFSPSGEQHTSRDYQRMQGYPHKCLDYHRNVYNSLTTSAAAWPTIPAYSLKRIPWKIASPSSSAQWPACFSLSFHAVFWSSPSSCQCFSSLPC